MVVWLVGSIDLPGFGKMRVDLGSAYQADYLRNLPAGSRSHAQRIVAATCRAQLRARFRGNSARVAVALARGEPKP